MSAVQAATANHRSAASAIATMAALGLFGYAALTLALTATLPATPVGTATVAPQADAATETAVTSDSTAWPEIFGTATAEAPPPPPPPPVQRTNDYQLRGLMASDDGGWGILVGPAGEVLVRVGDSLSDGAVVTAIARDGITLLRDGQELQVAFDAAAATDPAAQTEGADVAASGATASTAPARASEPAAPLPTETVTLSLAGLNNGDFRRMMARAGGIGETDTETDGPVLEVLFVRPGQLYDRIGLRTGDRILSLNGIRATDNLALQAAAGELLSASAYTLEVIRNGQRLAIAVTLDQDD